MHLNDNQFDKYCQIDIAAQVIGCYLGLFLSLSLSLCPSPCSNQTPHISIVMVNVMLAILVKAWDEINEKDVDEEVKMICYGFDTLSNKNGMQVGKSVMLG